MRFVIFIIMLTAFAAAEEKKEPRAIIDFFYPQTAKGKVILPKGTAVDDSRRFYEAWFKRTYFIRDTVVLTGAPALELLSTIKNCTEEKDTHGLSGHNARYGVTIISGSDKPFVTTFCFLSDTWIRKSNGAVDRANITRPTELEDALMKLDPNKHNQTRHRASMKELIKLDPP